MTTLQEVRSIARKHHIKTSGLSEFELIRKIQQSEQGCDCFATAFNDECERLDCRWRNDCFAAAIC